MKNNHFYFYLLVFVFVFVICLSPIRIFASEPSFEWVKKIGGTDYNWGARLLTDANDNVYILGNFSGTMDFDPGEGVFEVTASGTQDAFITKLNASGNHLWTKTFGGNDTVDAYSIALDSSEDNIYLTGYLIGIADFDPGESTAELTANGSRDVFILKLDSADGEYVWAKNIGGAGVSSSGKSLKIDAGENVYLSGYFSGTVDFDPGEDVTELTASGMQNAFVLKLNSNGEYVWAKAILGTGQAIAWSLVLDSNANSYISGYFTDTFDFDPSDSAANLVSSGSYDIFILKLNSDGEYVWAKNIGGTGSDSGEFINYGADNNLYIIGYFSNTVDFNSGEGTFELTSNGDTDIFILKLNSDGEYVWAKNIGGTGEDYGSSLYLDSSNNIYFTGYFYGAVDFDPSDSEAILNSGGLSTVFTSKFDLDGSYLWAKNISGGEGGMGYSIVLDLNKNIYITGEFYGTVDFDPGEGVAAISSVNGDTFLQKFSQDEPVLPVLEEITPIGTTSDKTPTYIFSTDKAGTITYGGSCSSVTTLAAEGENSITFNELDYGTYSDCTITVTDSDENTSMPLTVTTFIIESIPTPAVTRTHSGGYVRLPTLTIPIITKKLSNNIFPNFTLSLRSNIIHWEVKNLQLFLNSNGFQVSSSGAGSPGNETNYFGQKTKQALIKFQKVNGLVPDGVLGPKTRAVINALLKK